MQVECNNLQKECSVLRSEKQDVVGKHQKERSSLQSECASLRVEKEELLKTQQREKASLQSECAALRSDNEALLQKQKQLEKDLTRSERCLICLCCTPHASPSDTSPADSCVILSLVVCVPRTRSSAEMSKPWRYPSRSWRRGWRPCSFSTSRTAQTCKHNSMMLRAAARFCRERYALRLDPFLWCLTNRYCSSTASVHILANKCRS